ncbi:MAG: class I SAM-dependent methyltransferase, partial [Candidatus Komeilibacteria bacterium]|nr:class I SAM-dependent methyltransferase [Candidatus Komeilibacteria bacterium]
MKDIIQFNKYSDYYDLFYQKKDYQAEVKFLRAAIAKHSNRKVKSILSLGCGTAGHDIILAKQGFKMTSVDFSKRMLDLAKIKAKKQGAAIDFVLGDVRKVKIKKKFDLVVAMFNIAGYQNSNSDIVDFMATAARHLN